jgi:hypothetical protein
MGGDFGLFSRQRAAGDGVVIFFVATLLRLPLVTNTCITTHLTLPQNYFTKLLEDRTKCVIKPQYVDHIPKARRAIASRLGLITSLILFSQGLERRRRRVAQREKRDGSPCSHPGHA